MEPEKCFFFWYNNFYLDQNPSLIFQSHLINLEQAVNEKQFIDFNLENSR